jgi:hypothetical protein
VFKAELPYLKELSTDVRPLSASCCQLPLHSHWHVFVYAVHTVWALTFTVCLCPVSFLHILPDPKSTSFGHLCLCSLLSVPPPSTLPPLPTPQPSVLPRFPHPNPLHPVATTLCARHYVCLHSTGTATRHCVCVRACPS